MRTGADHVQQEMDMPKPEGSFPRVDHLVRPLRVKLTARQKCLAGGAPTMGQIRRKQDRGTFWRCGTPRLRFAAPQLEEGVEDDGDGPVAKRITTAMHW